MEALDNKNPCQTQMFASKTSQSQSELLEASACESSTQSNCKVQNLNSHSDSNSVKLSRLKDHQNNNNAQNGDGQIQNQIPVSEVPEHQKYQQPSFSLQESARNSQSAVAKPAEEPTELSLKSQSQQIFQVQNSSPPLQPSKSPLQQSVTSQTRNSHPQPQAATSAAAMTHGLNGNMTESSHSASLQSMINPGSSNTALQNTRLPDPQISSSSKSDQEKREIQYSKQAQDSSLGSAIDPGMIQVQLLDEIKAGLQSQSGSTNVVNVISNHYRIGERNKHIFSKDREGDYQNSHEADLRAYGGQELEDKKSEVQEEAANSNTLSVNEIHNISPHSVEEVDMVEPSDKIFLTVNHTNISEVELRDKLVDADNFERRSRNLDAEGFEGDSGAGPEKKSKRRRRHRRNHSSHSCSSCNNKEGYKHSHRKHHRRNHSKQSHKESSPIRLDRSCGEYAENVNVRQGFLPSCTGVSGGGAAAARNLLPSSCNKNVITSSANANMNNNTLSVTVINNNHHKRNDSKNSNFSSNSKHSSASTRQVLEIPTTSIASASQKLIVRYPEKSDAQKEAEKKKKHKAYVIYVAILFIITSVVILILVLLANS